MTLECYKSLNLPSTDFHMLEVELFWGNNVHEWITQMVQQCSLKWCKISMSSFKWQTNWIQASSPEALPCNEMVVASLWIFAADSMAACDIITQRSGKSVS